MDSNKRGMNMSFYVDTEEVKVLDDIRWREHMSLSEIVRKAIKEYIKIHAAGNDTYKLTEWAENPNFIAMPATMSNTSKWNEYVNKHMDRKERDKLDKQLDYIRMLIKSKNHREDMEK